MWRCAGVAVVVATWLLTLSVHAEQPRPRRPQGVRDHEEPHEHDTEERPLTLTLDSVVGFGKLPVLAEASELARGHVVSESLVVVGSYELTHHIGAEIRVPLTLGQLNPPGSDARTVFAFGNIELEGEYILLLSAALHMRFEIGVALPTAEGREAPESEALEGASLSRSARRAIDRGAVQRAAASSRGFEDEALFEVDRLGIVPKISLDYHHGRFLFGPFVKLENLFNVGEERGVEPLIELLVGGYAGVALNDLIELRGRLWCDLVLEGRGESVAVAEPQLVLHAGIVRFAVGGILPFAGALTDPYFAGVRAVLGLRI